jgi:hypothetical protein
MRPQPSITRIGCLCMSTCDRFVEGIPILLNKLQQVIDGASFDNLISLIV